MEQVVDPSVHTQGSPHCQVGFRLRVPIIVEGPVGDWILTRVGHGAIVNVFQGEERIRACFQSHRSGLDRRHKSCIEALLYPLGR